MASSQFQGSKGNSGTGGERGQTSSATERSGDIRQNLQEMGTMARDVANQTVDQIRETAQERAGQLRSTAEEYYNVGRDRASELERSLEERIREKPINSVLVAAGVGMLLGIVWMRR